MSYGYEYGADAGGGGGGGYGGYDGMNAGGYGDNAGGFLADTGGGAGGGSEKKSSRDKQSMIPVSVKQLTTATKEDESFRVDGVELNIIKLVGMLERRVETSTTFVFYLNDGTSVPMECKLWKENKAYRLSDMADGTLVSVFGNLKEYEGKTHVHVYDDVHKVENFDELTYHLLDIILVHCQTTKGPIPGGPAAATGGMGAATPIRPGQGMNPSTGQQRAPPMKVENKGLEEAVMAAYMQSGDNPQGLHFQQAMDVLRNHNNPITEAVLRQVVARLSDDGRLYTTIDEDHYKPTAD